MSDRIYSNDPEYASDNFVLVAQACYGVLTKIHYINSQTKSYDHVKRFNFFEVNIWTLEELYRLSERMLSKPRCCFIRARIKDHNNRKYVLRRSVGEEATLLSYRCNWFALDIDGYGVSSGNLKADVYDVLLALPSVFQGIDCFAIASSSYGIKPGIHIRLFFWSQNIVSGSDLNKFLNIKWVDPALFTNPIQPIYTSAPIFESDVDPIAQRIVWIDGDYVSVNVPSQYVHAKGMKEIEYTKQEADRQLAKYLRNISRLSPGERHPGLIQWCYPIGKLVGQNHYDRDDMIEIVMNHCDFWNGKRDTKKDRDTVTGIIDRGINSIEGDNHD